MSGNAFVTRINSEGQPEVYGIKFPSGRQGFQKWLKAFDHFPGIEQIDGPVKQSLGGATLYNGTTQANTVIVYSNPEESARVVMLYSMPDMLWKFLEAQAEEQDWGIEGSGRRAKFVQPMHTWRKWGKKQGAEY